MQSELETLLEQREKLAERLFIAKEEDPLILQKLLREKDYEIDAWEEQEEERAYRVLAYLEKNPVATGEGHNPLLQELEENQVSLKKIEADLLSLNPFFKQVQKGAEISLKRRSFFTFLFGTHPQVLLARVIFAAAAEGEAILPHLQDKTLILFIKEFIEEANQRWNKDLYAGKFQNFYSRLKGIQSLLQTQGKAYEAKICALHSALDKGLKK